MGSKREARLNWVPAPARRHREGTSLQPIQVSIIIRSRPVGWPGETGDVVRTPAVGLVSLARRRREALGTHECCRRLVRG